MNTKQMRLSQKISKSIIILNSLIIFLLAIVTLFGVFSFDLGNVFFTTNQYGDSVRMWGCGIYAHDSYMRATIFIGTDFTMLIVLIPLICFTFFRLIKNATAENAIQNLSTIGVALYYSASLCFGVSYNKLILLYIALFSSSLFCTIILFLKIWRENQNYSEFYVSRGLKVFLVISGISLFVAWLPDIISAMIKGRALDLIEVYTTEATYILDMGIISPLIFISLYLAKKKDFLGFLIIRMVLRICIIVGIMVIFQTAVQMYASVEIPLPALITKSLIFVVLSVFAIVFENNLNFTTTSH